MGNVSQFHFELNRFATDTKIAFFWVENRSVRFFDLDGMVQYGNIIELYILMTYLLRKWETINLTALPSGMQY